MFQNGPTQDSCIAVNRLVMNLEKLLELLFIFFAALLRLLLVNDEGSDIRALPLMPQKAEV
jgi:hypothetical protein